MDTGTRTEGHIFIVGNDIADKQAELAILTPGTRLIINVSPSIHQCDKKKVNPNTLTLCNIYGTIRRPC